MQLNPQIPPPRIVWTRMQALSEERRHKLKGVGLHYCKYYNNIVRFNEPACGHCPHCTYPRQ
jgi:hypothetical protein